MAYSLKEVAELTAGVTFVRIGWTWLSRKDAQEFLAGLDDDGKVALLELMASAALDDGEISDREREYLDRQGDGVGASVVVAALDAVKAALPFANAEAHMSFLAERGERLPDDFGRRHAFIACMCILDDARAPDLSTKATMYGEALRVPESERVYHQVAVGMGAGRDN